MWQIACPDTYIWKWSSRGKVIFTANDADPLQIRKTRQIFYYEYIRKTLRFHALWNQDISSVLVEKLPINVYRLPFIHAIFPEARFIYIYRNGFEVAHSIKHFLDNPVPYPDWSKMIASLNLIAEPELAKYVDNNYLKSLLCWRMNMEYATDFLATLAPEKYTQLSYQELVDKPGDTAKRILTFMGLSDNPDCMRFARENISRQSPPPERKSLSEQEQFICGKWLPALISEENRPTEI